MDTWSRGDAEAFATNWIDAWLTVARSRARASFATGMACANYIASQKCEGWTMLAERYDDGGFSGGTLERPAIQRLLADVRLGLVNTIVVYKIDRLSRSLADVAKLVELFDQYKVSFVSVTQSSNTTTSMGRLTLNILLSFAQFERERSGERVRDKIAASRKRGIWMDRKLLDDDRTRVRNLVDQAGLSTAQFCGPVSWATRANAESWPRRLYA